MKVLVADRFEKTGLDGLKAAGCDVLYQPDLKDDSLTAAIRDSGADVLVVRSTAVTAPSARSWPGAPRGWACRWSSGAAASSPAEPTAATRPFRCRSGRRPRKSPLARTC